MAEQVKIACVQLDVEPGEPARNLESVARYIALAGEEGADVVTFPEAALADYYHDDYHACAAPIPGAHTEAVGATARKHGVWVAIGLVESAPEGLHNSAVLISSEGEVRGLYRKTHLSVDDRGGTIAKEADVFLPGDSIDVFDTPWGKTGMMICKDGDYPEVSRVLAVKGAEIVLWLTNRGGVNRISCRHYSLVNKVILVACNRAEGHAAGGGSAIYDWHGEALVSANREERLISAVLDVAEMREQREPYWREARVRRPGLYGGLVGLQGPFEDVQ